MHVELRRAARDHGAAVLVRQAAGAVHVDPEVDAVDGHRVVDRHLRVSERVTSALIVVQVGRDAARCRGLSEQMVRVARGGHLKAARVSE